MSNFPFTTFFFFMLRFLPLAALLLLAVASHAQPSNGGPTPNPAGNPTGAPIDGGVSLLLAGGAAYAVRHLRRRRVA